ncbi:MAG: Ribonuclease BN, partial [uncultured Solirubrobacteraceae bacterium]
EARRCDRQAHGRLVLQRPDDTARGGADVLRADVAVPRGAARALVAGAVRPVPGHVRCDHRLPARRRAVVGARSARQVAAQRAAQPGNRRDGARDQRALRVVRDDRRAGGGAPRAQRRARGRRWPQLPAAQGDRRRVDVHADEPRAHQPRARLRRRIVRAGHARLHRHRAPGRADLERRALARRAGGRDADLRLHLLRHARRQAALVPVGAAGRRRRRPAVACRLVRLLGVHLRGLQRGRDLRGVHRRDPARRVAVAHARRAAVRRRAQRRDRARARAGRGRADGGDAQPADAARPLV